MTNWRTALQYDGDIFDFYMSTYNRKKREWTIEKWKEIEQRTGIMPVSYKS